MVQSTAGQLFHFDGEINTGNDRYSGHSYSGIDRYSGTKNPDDAILFTVSGITVIADKTFGDFDKNAASKSAEICFTKGLFIM